MQPLELISSTVISSKMRCSNSKVITAAKALGMEPVGHTSSHGFIMQGFTKEQEHRIVDFLKKKPITERETKVTQARQLIAGGMGTLKALKQVGLAWSSFQYKPRHNHPRKDNGLLSTPDLALKLGGWNVGYIRRVAVELMNLKPIKTELIGGRRKIFYWSEDQLKKIKTFMEGRNHTWLQGR